MSDIIPIPRQSIEIRPGVASDLAFIDALQKKTTKMVGWMPTKQLEGKIAAGQVLVAWAASPCSLNQGDFTGEGSRAAGGALVPLGYLISQDQYFKRDDVGIIYQLNVAPGHQRSLIGATLIKSVFERAAYGCRLFCCWCAQDIAANQFWESLGFIPLAYRAGSRARKRVHIFWQRRIVEGDGSTPYWFPAQTKGGAISEDRLVLPIPPGVHWSQVQPVLLPGSPRAKDEKKLPGPKAAAKPQMSKPMGLGRLWFAPAKTAIQPRAKSPKPKLKNNPEHAKAARELRDRYLEHFNRGIVLPAGKYAVGRALTASSPLRALPDAA